MHRTTPTTSAMHTNITTATTSVQVAHLLARSTSDTAPATTPSATTMRNRLHRRQFSRVLCSQIELTGMFR